MGETVSFWYNGFGFGKRVLFLVKRLSFWEKDFGKTFVFVGFDFGKKVLILVKRRWLGYTAFDFGERIFDQKVYVRQKTFRFGFKKSDFGKSFFVTRLLAGLLLAAGCLLLSLAPANSLTSSSMQTHTIHNTKMQSRTTSRRASSRRSFSVFLSAGGVRNEPWSSSYLPTLLSSYTKSQEAIRLSWRPVRRGWRVEH